MNTTTYRAWVHPRKKLSLVYSRHLDGWILKKHRKDGAVAKRWPVVFGSGPGRDEALQRIRANYEQQPPMSGWQRATSKVKAATWDQLHQEIYTAH